MSGAVQVPNMVYCPECGAENAVEAQFCGSCGATLTEAVEGGGEDVPQGDNRSPESHGGGHGRDEAPDGVSNDEPYGQNNQAQQRETGREPAGSHEQSRGQPQQGGSPQQGQPSQGHGRAHQGRGQAPQGHGRAPQGQGQPPQGQGRAPQGGHPQGGQARQYQGGRGQNALPQETNGVFDFAIGYPKRGSWTPAILSSVMLLLSILIVPLFIAIGYGFRVARAAALGRPFPPAFEDWGGLLYDGLRFIAVSLLAGLIWGVFAVLIIGGLFAAGSDAGAGFAFFVLYIAAGWFIGAFQTAFVGSNSVPNAIVDRRALSLLTSGYYLKAWLLTIVLGIIFNIIFLISSLTIIGPIFVAGYAVLAYGAFWGYVYYRATQKGIVEPPVDDPQPAPPAGGPQQQPPR